MSKYGFEQMVAGTSRTYRTNDDEQKINRIRVAASATGKKTGWKFITKRLKNSLRVERVE